jgi:hypothetical protein
MLIFQTNHDQMCIHPQGNNYLFFFKNGQRLTLNQDNMVFSTFQGIEKT